MLGEDVQPSRLARARHKLRDLLERRRGARTALVAYAGSAHVALPLTDDAELLESYLDALDPGLMPRPGNDPGSKVSTTRSAPSTSSRTAASPGSPITERFEQARNWKSAPSSPARS